MKLLKRKIYKLKKILVKLIYLFVPFKKLRSKRKNNHNYLNIPSVNKEYEIAQRRINFAKNLVDIGCGINPHPNAKVGVDGFIEPIHRGTGYFIEKEKLEKEKNIKFIEANVENLPFKDKEFDFSYSHHMIEHVENPREACKEIMRISEAGVIICPSIFAEYAFGRPYHLWFVMKKGNTLIFIKKSQEENQPFGDFPKPNKNKDGYIFDEKTNPFDILLDDGSWYKGKEKMPRLANLIQKYWHSRSEITEVILNWENSFNVLVIDENGNLL